MSVVRLADFEQFDEYQDINDIEILQKFIQQLRENKISTLYKSCTLTYVLLDTMNDKSQWNLLNCLSSDQINEGLLSLRVISESPPPPE